MKKESFTFSDKLKKSKTLPLSKRIPSRIGGEVKAKRTLFERAQRDLPFIIVAALALLLLPFLSRESVDEMPSVVWPGSEDSTYIEENLPKSVSEDLPSAGLVDPLGHIIKTSDRDSRGVRDSFDSNAYGEDSDGSSSGAYKSSSSASSEEDYYSSRTPATGRYGKTVKRSVRNTISRTPTSIGSLSKSGMARTDGAGGFSHALAFGSRPKDDGQRSARSGIRPVALQPLTASGKGRDLTGDALYSEAARSIGAMNKPGAKQALLDAQLKDVDGKALGEAKGGPGSGDPNRPGAGDGPANSWGHNSLKPWWWDMMNQRAQKRWDLWHYNWERMVSDNLIKLTSGLWGCLMTGSSDFKVDKFFGAPGSKKYRCFDASGKEIVGVGDFSEFSKGYTSTSKTKEGGSDTSIDPAAFAEYKAFCKENHGEVRFTKGARDGFWDTRFDCLGFSLDRIKEKTEVKRDAMCEMYGDPMVVNIAIKRNGKEKVNKIKNMGYYVVNSAGCVVDLEKAKYGRNEIDYNALVSTYTDSDDKTIEAKPAKVVVYRVGSYTMLEDSYLDTDDVYVDGKKYRENFSRAKAIVDSPKTACMTEDQLKEILKPVGKWRTEDNARRRFNEIAVCQVPKNRFTSTKISPVEINPDESKAGASGIQCDDRVVNIDYSNTKHAIRALIKDPGPRTFAVVLEYTQGGPTVGEEYTNDKLIKDRTGYLVKEVIDFSQENAWHSNEVDSEGRTIFKADFVAGLSSTIKDDTGHETATAGKGYVIWITTDDPTSKVIEKNDLAKGKTLAHLMKNISADKGYQTAQCEYEWGCEGRECSAVNEYFCYDDKGTKEKGPFYQAVRVGNYYFKGSNAPVNSSQMTSNPVKCDPLCKFLDGTYGVVDTLQDPPAPKGNEKFAASDLPTAATAGCPKCNPKPEEKYCTYKGELYPCKLVGDKLIRKSTEKITDPNAESLGECTPICANKLKHILESDPNSPLEPIDPKNPITTNPNDIDPVEPGNEDLCPYCNPKGEEPKEDPIVRLDPNTTIDFSEPCVVKLTGDFFKNASYILKSERKADMAQYLDRVYKYLKDCGDIAVEGHASKTMLVGKESGYTFEEAKERNNLRLSFDRALEVTELIRPIWQSKQEIVNIDLSDKFNANREVFSTGKAIGDIGDTNYTGENSNREEQSLPKSRKSISSPVASGATTNFIIQGMGSQFADERRDKSKLTEAEKKDWREKEMKDRKVILRGTKNK